VPVVKRRVNGGECLCYFAKLTLFSLPPPLIPRFPSAYASGIFDQEGVVLLSPRGSPRQSAGLARQAPTLANLVRINSFVRFGRRGEAIYMDGLAKAMIIFRLLRPYTVRMKSQTRAWHPTRGGFALPSPYIAGSIKLRLDWVVMQCSIPSMISCRCEGLLTKS